MLLKLTTQAERLIRRLYLATEYSRLRRAFISNGKGHSVSPAERASLVRKFERIDASVPIASSPGEGLFLAELALQLGHSGDVVECGCYCGGSTAKLSLLVQITGGRLHVFDSFEGLPDVDSQNLTDYHARHGASWVTPWTKGRYAARLSTVQANVAKFGALSSCRFVKGWFQETLNESNLPDRISMVFSDVDIPSSASGCFEALWPRIADGGAFVSHDVAYLKVLRALARSEAWPSRAEAPVILGAGFGLGDVAPHLGFLVKGNWDPAYVKSLLIDRH